MNSAKQQIREVHDQLTTVERSIAAFFLDNEQQRDFGQRSVANLLYVSEASLSRFAQKCQYKGYREFIWHYEHDLVRHAALVGDPAAPLRSLRDDCQYQLEQILANIDVERLRHVALRLQQAPRICIFASGYAGLAAREFELRFLHLGFPVLAITDIDDMPMRAALAVENEVVIGMTLKQNFPELAEALQRAQEHGAFTLLITTEADFAARVTVDECILPAGGRQRDSLVQRSPQIPLLLVTDALCAVLQHCGENK